MQLEKLGTAHLCNLRICSKHWRDVCDQETLSASVPAQQLANVAPFLNALPRLESLTVRGPKDGCNIIPSNAFSCVRANLKSLSLKYEEYVYNGPSGRIPWRGLGYFQGDHHDDMTLDVRNLGKLLQPWYETIEVLHLNHCYLRQYNGGAQTNQLCFAQLPYLRKLYLLHSIIGSLGDLSCLDMSGCSALNLIDCLDCNIHNLNLSGCCALESVHCQYNSISSLTLLECISLVTVNCQHNSLTTLTFSSSASLRHLKCDFNRNLTEILLQSDSMLDTLTCDYCNQQLIIKGCVNLNVSALECESPVLRQCSLAMRQHLLSLCISSTPSLGVGDLHGFQDLKLLDCSFFQDDTGCIDLTQCTNVELTCVFNQRFHLLGSQNVQKLIARQIFSCPPDLSGFAKLRELELDFEHNEGSVDLSHCTELQKVVLRRADSQQIVQRGVQTICKSTVILYKCLALEELTFESMPRLTEIDLSRCVGLKALSCIKTGLTTLDLTQCPNLEYLDISGSKLVRDVLRNNTHVVLRIITSSILPPKFKGDQHVLNLEVNGSSIVVAWTWLQWEYGQTMLARILILICFLACFVLILWTYLYGGINWLAA